VETDWRPNRVELRAPGRGRVDLHPLVVDEDGSAKQAALDGGFHIFPSTFFAVGSLAAYRFLASPSPPSVTSTPAMSCEAPTSTTWLSSTRWTAATAVH
jgi:aminoglycoside-2''-adenylyltransferase